MDEPNLRGTLQRVGVPLLETAFFPAADCARLRENYWLIDVSSINTIDGHEHIRAIHVAFLDHSQELPWNS